MSSAPTLANTGSVVVATTSEAVLAQVQIPYVGPVGPVEYVQGATWRITCVCTFTIGGTAGTITANVRIGGLGGQLVATFVTGTLTLSTSGAIKITGEITLINTGVGVASNWNGSVTMLGTGTGASPVGAGVGTATLSTALPQILVVTVTPSSATTTVTCTTSLTEQVV